MQCQREHLLFDTSEALVQNSPNFRRFLSSFHVPFPWISTSASQGSILPVFNDDRCYFTPTFLLSSDKVPSPPTLENTSQIQRKCEDWIRAQSAWESLIPNLRGNKWRYAENPRPGPILKLLPDMPVPFQKLRLAPGAKEPHDPVAPQRVQRGHPGTVFAGGGNGECLDGLRQAQDDQEEGFGEPHY